MAEISFTGQRHLSTLQREFTDHFPYLGLVFYTEEEHAKTERGEAAHPMETNVTIAAARTRKGDDISLNGRWLVGNFEMELAKQYGFFVQVSIRTKDGKGSRYTGGELDAMNLRTLNNRAAEAGFPKYEY